jgi:DNA polymerase-3 subunit epsilon
LENNNELKYISETQFVVIDVETTGQNAVLGRITEIAMVKVIDGQIVDEYSTLINPEQFIPPYITQMTGITNEMVFTAPKFKEVRGRILSFLGDNIFTAHNVNFDFGFVNHSFLRDANISLTNTKLCTCRLARRLLPTLRHKSLDSLINHFHIRVENRHRALDDARATAFLLIHFLETLENKYSIELLDDLISFQYKKVFQIKKPPKNFSKVKETVENLFPQPGIYRFYDKYEYLIYIGKAKNLKDRVSSYFYHNVGHSPKIMEMVRKVHSIKYEVTGSELSALLLEEKLIKKNKPYYNSAQKRLRKYPFLKIDLSDEFPFLDWSYEIKNDGSEYFGPFISRNHIESFIEALNKIFKLRECKDKVLREKGRCIYPDLERCMAPCENGNKGKYWEEIQKIRNFLYGKNDDLLKRFEDIMVERSKNYRFEEAAELRDKIKLIKFFIKRQRYLPSSVNNSNFIVVVPCYRTSFEIFIIKMGKFIHSELFTKYNEEKTRLFIQNIFSNVTLFDREYSKFDPDLMQIIMCWVNRNYNIIKIINFNEESNLEEILKEIKNYLNN